MAGNTPEDEDDLTPLMGPPPPGFDKDYAHFLLAAREARRPKPWGERVTLIVALVASISGALVSFFNATLYWQDRGEAARKQTFDNQVTISRIYFEKMSGSGFCDKRNDAMLYARVALVSAGMKENDVLGRIKADVIEPADSNGLREVAYVIYKDFYQRDLEECKAGDVKTPDKPVASGEVVNALPPSSGEATGYGLAQGAAAPPAQGNALTVFIQYKPDTPGKERALAIQASLKSDPAYNAPGTQRVKAVPRHDQIRIYHAGDKDAALALQRKLGLVDAQIVNLETAFPNLPKGVMEVWLHE